MRFFRGFIFILLLLFSFVALSTLYINGVEGTLKLFKQLYSNQTTITKPIIIEDKPYQLNNPELEKIEKEIEELLQEIEEQLPKIDIEQIEPLSNITHIANLNAHFQLGLPKFELNTTHPITITKTTPPKKDQKPKINQIIITDMEELKEYEPKNRLMINVDISSQHMKVYKDGELLYHWKVSTGRRGYATPTGQYQPQYLVKMHYSKKYHNSPMPYSIFFRGGYACHGTRSVWRLGRRASHGCIRLHTTNAKKLYYLVQNVGKENSFINIQH